MATNPETVAPSTPPPQGDAARQAQGRVAIREYLRQNKGKATLKGVTDLAAAFGLDLTDPKIVNAAVEWANRKDTDIDLLKITTDPLAPATGDAAQTEITTPEAPPPEVQRTVGEAFVEGAADTFQLGLPQPYREEFAKYGLLAEYLGVPIADVGVTALTGLAAPFVGGALAAGQLAENIGAADLLTQVTGVKQTPEYIQRQILGIAESEGVRAPMGYIPPGYAVATGRVPVSPMRMAQALERAEPLPVTAPPTPMARIAQAPEPLPTRAPRAAAAAPTPARAPVIPQPTVALPARDLPTAPKDEIPQISIPEPVRVTPEQRAIDAAALDAAPPEELRNILTPTRQSEILSYQGDYATELAKMGILRPKNMPLTEFIQSHMLADTVPDNVRIALMEKHGIRSAQDQLRAVGISRESLSRAAQDLNKASQLERQLQRLFTENPELAKKFGASTEALRQLKSPYHRLLGIESGLLTTQMVTVVRNLLDATGVAPSFNALVELIDLGIRTGRNVGRAPDTQIPGPDSTDILYGFLDQFVGTLTGLARPGIEGVLNAPVAAINKARVGMGLPPLAKKDIRVYKTDRAKRRDEFMEAFRAALPNKYNTLFGRWASDQPLPRGDTTTKLGKALSKTEDAVDFLNIPNRVVDRAAKNAQFMSILQMEGKRAGINVNKLFDEGRLSELKNSDVVDKAVRLMHKRVFEDRPEGPQWYNELSRAGIVVMNYLLRPLGLGQFPNFAVSFLKQVFEQNPLAIVRFISDAEIEKIAKGDTREVAKIGAGLATTLGYFAMKDPDDGTKWYEFKIGDTPVDMSAAFARHLPNMLQAHVMHLWLQDRLDEFDWGKDLAKVLGTSNLRAGVGQYAVDEGFREVIAAAQAEDFERAKRVAENWARERVSGWPIIFRSFRDTFDREQAALNRDPQTIAQEFTNNFPGGARFYEYMTGEEIPRRFAPTRPEATQRGDPLAYQLTGALIREPRNKLEELVVDLGMSNSQLVPRSGISDTYDRLMVQEVGRLTGEQIDGERSLLERVERREAKLRELPPEELRMRIREAYSDLRKIARDNLMERMPIYYSAAYYNRLSKDEKRARDKKDLANPQKRRAFPEFFREVEEAGVTTVAFSKKDRETIPSGTTYADVPTYSIKVKP